LRASRWDASALGGEPGRGVAATLRGGFRPQPLERAPQSCHPGVSKFHALKVPEGPVPPLIKVKSAATCACTLAAMNADFDAYSPREIAERVEAACLAKAATPLLSLVMLGVLAGAFIGLGSLFYVLVASDPSLGFAAQRVLGGFVFSLGLLLVVVAGAELFTGNNLLAMAWAQGRVSARDVLINWVVVCAANFVGAAGLALLVFLSQPSESISSTYIQIGEAKAELPFWTAFFRGVLCNVLVCMAVWMTLAGRSVVDKFVAIVMPVAAFVAAGFEHSIANMYFLPLGMMLGADIGLGWLWTNLVPVIAGNLVGGSVLVALVYYVIYRRPARAA
jgi:formate transporter